MGTRRLTQVALLAVLATGCSNAAETRTDDDALTTTRPTRAVGTNVEDLSRCVTPPQDVVAFIRKGLTDKRATLRFARAVKSTDPNFHYFVSAEIQAPGPFSGDDEIATWSVLEDLDDIAAFDLEAVNSVSGVAIEASTWPTSQELSMGIDGAWDSHVCVRAAL